MFFLLFSCHHQLFFQFHMEKKARPILALKFSTKNTPQTFSQGPISPSLYLKTNKINTTFSYFSWVEILFCSIVLHIKLLLSLQMIMNLTPLKITFPQKKNCCPCLAFKISQEMNQGILQFQLSEQMGSTLLRWQLFLTQLTIYCYFWVIFIHFNVCLPREKKRVLEVEFCCSLVQRLKVSHAVGRGFWAPASFM